MDLWQGQGDKILILGEMKELGQFSKDEHQKLVDYLQTLDTSELLYFMVKCLKPVFGKNPFMRNNRNNLQGSLIRQKECSILIKGSRSCRLGAVIRLNQIASAKSPHPAVRQLIFLAPNHSPYPDRPQKLIFRFAGKLHPPALRYTTFPKYQLFI